MSYRSHTSSTSSSDSGNSSGTYTPDSSLISMRVFLVQTAKGLFSSSGGFKANVSLLRHLASRGHTVRQICYSHRGEVDAYIRYMAKKGGHDPQLCRKLLHLRTGNSGSGIDVEVNVLVMDDGVQIVALEKEAFDTAFGGKENIFKTMGRETADYIEVIEPTNFAIAIFLFTFLAFLTFVLNREDCCRPDYTTLSRFCSRRSSLSHPHTSSSTMAYPCKPPWPPKCAI
jgi:hypothetical protein